MSVQLRQVECFHGPHDGRILTVASPVSLPNYIRFPSARGAEWVDRYELKGSSEMVMTYAYDKTEPR